MPPSTPSRSLCIVRGSINVDEFFHVHDIVKAGETISSTDYERKPGGKGANQAVAVARAGGAVEFVGGIGDDGAWLVGCLADVGVGVSGITRFNDVPTGRAIIQLDKNGENCIILHRGANYGPVPPIPSACLQSATHLLLQNEIPYETTLFSILLANSLGISTIFNPSPIPSAEQLRSFPWDKLTWLVMNEHEMYALYHALDAENVDLGSGEVSWPPDYQGGRKPPPRLLVCAFIVRILNTKHFSPNVHIVCTVGSEGVVCYMRNLGGPVFLPASELKGDIRDTTGAGDCFTGYFVAELMKLYEETGHHIPQTTTQITDLLIRCNQAAGMCVERRGAMEAIPSDKEVEERLATRS
ncbi:Ribokinase-like protein [Punctularia strigosozonata HHB-11173 SS5]|uniref:Ribokinase-like protein n=1 Tax=Punctularia strigosozonata (strain HHB-11173) TaxID=741275 RepID=UPI0004416B2F|nr:Ribokinase-like protein [Punctularia strigosozonata HHB-11173 SS5]EIN14471.1 Ribokinase-like protein [Punctularia strigosozonata HHB-11173 SS5]